MAEVGLLPFARVALQVATQVLPPYRTRFSKHQFTQPQLLAVLCLMRFEDWTFREAEVRLREHQELRAVLQLPAVPDYTTLYRFLRRLEDDTVDRGLQETVRRLRRRRRGPLTAAIDGTGLSDTSVSTFFPPTPGTAGPRAQAASSLVEVVDRRGCAAADFVGAAGSSGAGVRHAFFAGVARCGGTRRSDRYGARGCGVCFRSQPRTYSATLGSEKHYPRKAAGRPERYDPESDVPRLSQKTIPATH
jgi:Transposase domain (DUF772)